LEALLRGVLCNILVCIAVWMSFSSDKTGDKIIAVIFPVTFFALCGFEHSVANMYFIPAGMMLNLKLSISGQGATLFGFLVKNLLPVTIGNLIGGVLIGAVYRFVYSRKTDK
ncbi:MAG: formate/nitrite transporter family protein, partial [Acutalibacteraceae bacterium]